MEQCSIDSPLARVAIVVWKNPMNQTITKSTARAICQWYILKLFRPRSNGENNLSYWVEGSPSLSSQLKQTFIWEKKATPLPPQRRKMSDLSTRDHVIKSNFNMAAKSSFVCLFQKKEEKMRLMSFRPPMQHFFQSSGIFTILLFLLFLPVGFVFCNVCALAYRMQLWTYQTLILIRPKPMLNLLYVTWSRVVQSDIFRRWTYALPMPEPTAPVHALIV